MLEFICFLYESSAVCDNSAFSKIFLYPRDSVNVLTQGQLLFLKNLKGKEV